MLFDRPASLPIATMRSTSRLATLASQLRGARTSGWRWFRPRIVPAAVALVGMLAVLGAAEYLTHLARYTPVQSAQVEQPTKVITDTKVIQLSPNRVDVEYRSRVVAESYGSIQLAPAR